MPQALLPTRSAPAPLLACLFAIALVSATHAQTSTKGVDEGPQIATPPEFSEEARRSYVAGLREARGLIADKRYADALARLDDLLKERPREAQARFLRTVALSDSGRGDEAIAALRDLVADYPELPEAHNNLAVLYAGRGEYEIARDELALAIAARPDYAVARENLGDVYVRLAAGEYERAGKLDPTNKRASAKLKLAREIVAASH